MIGAGIGALFAWGAALELLPTGNHVGFWHPVSVLAVCMIPLGILLSFLGTHYNPVTEGPVRAIVQETIRALGGSISGTPIPDATRRVGMEPVVRFVQHDPGQPPLTGWGEAGDDGGGGETR